MGVLSVNPSSIVTNTLLNYPAIKHVTASPLPFLGIGSPTPGRAWKGAPTTIKVSFAWLDRVNMVRYFDAFNLTKAAALVVEATRVMLVSSPYLLR